MDPKHYALNANPAEAVPQTFISPVEAAHSTADMLLERIAKLADKLVGTVPEAGVNANKLAAVPSGIFGMIEERAGQTNYMLERCLSLVNRFENALP